MTTLVVLLTTLAAADDVSIDIRAAVPATTPADATVYLAGSGPAVGGWRPDGVKLVRGADGLQRATLRLPRGVTLEYKLTLGTWALVEKSASGGEVPNRRLLADGNKTVEVVVEAWADGIARPKAS